MRIFLLLFLFSGFSVFAQDSKIDADVSDLKTKISFSKDGERLKWLDSLSKRIHNKKEYQFDSITKVTIDYALKLDSLNMAAWHASKLIFFKNNILNKHDEGLRIFEKFIHNTKELKNDNTLGELYLNGADCYYFTGNIKEAFKLYEIARNYALKADNKKLLGTVNLYLGFAFTEMVNLQDASKHLQIAKKYFIEIKDSVNIIAANYGLSQLFSRNGFYGEAKKVRDDAISLAKKNQDNINLAILYFNSAQDLRKNGKLEESIRDLLLAAEFEEKAGNNDYIYSKIICEIVVAYIENNQLGNAEKYLIEINKNIERVKNDENIENYLEVQKNLALAHKEFRKALSIGEEHLALEKKKFKVDKIIEAENFLSKVYLALGDKSKADYHKLKYYRLKDSVFSEQKLKYFSFYQSLFDFQEKDFKIQSQKKDLELLEKSNRAKNIWFFLGAITLVSIFAFIILMRARNAAKINENLSQAFSQNLITAQDNERHNLARDLHDSIGQRLVVLYKKIKSFDNDDMALFCKNTIEEVRTISRGLYPPQIEGIAYTEAIHSLINEIDRNTNIFFTCEIDSIDHLLTKEQEVHLYRIIQEIFSNILKHSDAKAVFVLVEKSTNFIKIRIEDNGNGFDYSEKQSITSNLGMKTILERSKIIDSKIEIKTELNKGTIIQLIIPFK